MKVAFHIAIRYFLSKEKQKFINYISLIAMLTIALGAAAMLIVMSAFNGLKEQIQGVHTVFDPEIKIELIEGKSFSYSDSLKNIVENTPGVGIITEVIEDDAFLLYRKSQKLVKIKGVTENYTKQNKIQDYIRVGNTSLFRQGIAHGLIGVGIQYEMGISLGNSLDAIKVWYPKKDKKIIKADERSFNTLGILPGGIFEIERAYDEQYVFLPLNEVEELTDNIGKRTALEIKTKENFSIKKTIHNLKKTLGDDFRILGSEEQHSYIYKAIKVEKLMALIIISALLILASFTTFLTLSMLVLSKEKDIAYLMSMGAPKALITKVYLIIGGLIGFIGTSIGVILGSLLCFLQEKYGFIGMGVESALVDAYPVKLEYSDIWFVTLISFGISLLISIKPAYKSYHVNIKENL